MVHHGQLQGNNFEHSGARPAPRRAHLPCPLLVAARPHVVHCNLAHSVADLEQLALHPGCGQGGGELSEPVGSRQACAATASMQQDLAQLSACLHARTPQGPKALPAPQRACAAAPTATLHPPGSVILFLRARSEMQVANWPQPLAGHSSQRCGRFLGEELPGPSPPATAAAAAAGAPALPAPCAATPGDAAAGGAAGAPAPPAERFASGCGGEAAAARGDCTLSACCLGGCGALCCCWLGGGGAAPLFCRSTCGRAGGCRSCCRSCCASCGMERCRLSVERSPEVLLDALRVVRSWTAGGRDGAVGRGPAALRHAQRTCGSFLPAAANTTCAGGHTLPTQAHLGDQELVSQRAAAQQAAHIRKAGLVVQQVGEGVVILVRICRQHRSRGKQVDIWSMLVGPPPGFSLRCPASFASSHRQHAAPSRRREAQQVGHLPSGKCVPLSLHTAPGRFSWMRMRRATSWATAAPRTAGTWHQGGCAWQCAPRSSGRREPQSHQPRHAGCTAAPLDRQLQQTAAATDCSLVE